MVVENKPGAGGSIAAQAVKAAPADGYTLMFTISTTMIMNRVLYKNLPYDRRQGLRAHLQHVGRASAARRQQGHGSYQPQGVRRVCAQEQGEHRHLCGRLLRAHRRCRAEQALRPADGGRALPRRGADVAGSGGGRHPGRQRQLCRRLQRSAVGRGPADRRAAEEAHEQASRRCHLPRAGRDLKGLPAPGLHLPGRPRRSAAGDRPARVGPDGRRRKKRARAQVARHLRRRRIRRRARGLQEAGCREKARSGSASSRASA